MENYSSKKTFFKSVKNNQLQKCCNKMGAKKSIAKSTIACDIDWCGQFLQEQTHDTSDKAFFSNAATVDK